MCSAILAKIKNVNTFLKSHTMILRDFIRSRFDSHWMLLVNLYNKIAETAGRQAKYSDLKGYPGQFGTVYERETELSAHFCVPKQ